jgi:sugar lactone lactonase YvrE
MLWVCGGCSLLIMTAASFADTVPFDSPQWVLENTEIVEHLGRTSLKGAAYLPDVEFANGIIEVDLAVTNDRSYPGIMFRRHSDGNYEEFYMRPHRSKFYPDVLQYAPTFNGISEWQLYSGPGFTAGAVLPRDQWIHLRLEVLGSQARVFIDSAATPALEIPELQHGVSRGAIGLTGPRDGTAHFSNFRYELTDSLGFDPPDVRGAPYGMIADWELTQAFNAGQVDLERTPEAQGLSGIVWTPVRALSTGLVDIARHTGRTTRVADCVFARTTIRSEQLRTMRLRFGYSDAVTVFLNGSPVFSGSSTYQGRDPSFLGIVGLNDEVYLPLLEGENELVCAVAESFGGWGFMCQDADAVFVHNALSAAWELPRTLRMPESVVYDPARDVLYVSNYFNDGQEFLSKFRPDGTLEILEWVTGLNMPTGLCLRGDTLYVAERRTIAKVDVTTGVVTAHVPVPDAVFLNDLDFDAEGSLYVSDSRGNKVHRLKGGVFETWLEAGEIRDPNGLCIDGNELLLGNSGDGSLKAIDLSTKEIRTVARFGAGSVMDGLHLDGRDNYLVSDFNGRLFRVSPGGATELLLNTSAPQRFCADFAYIRELKLLVIPTLYDNQVIAYHADL